MDPQEYQRELKVREAAVVERIVDIRSAEQAFKQKNQRYTADWDSLINFVLSDSLVYERQIGSKDDSVAVARGLVRTEQFTRAVRDTIFAPRKLSAEQIRNMKFIPYADQGTQYILNAAMLTTESKVVVPVFEAKAPYKLFMADLDQQELINLIDASKNVYHKYPGIAVGAIDRATNDAGNWE
ncbi:MAG: hypothetical protein LBV38_01320 [Alistipes sp.]|nr:hypothetical protein [Alistipes sp.]